MLNTGFFIVDLRIIVTLLPVISIVPCILGEWWFLVLSIYYLHSSCYVSFALLLPFFFCLIVVHYRCSPGLCITCDNQCSLILVIFFNISICGSHCSIVFILINKLVVLPSLWLLLSCLSFILMILFRRFPSLFRPCCLLFILMVMIFVVSPHWLESIGPCLLYTSRCV